jgi:hypothetical protein
MVSEIKSKQSTVESVLTVICLLRPSVLCGQSVSESL